jgi:hypothetical protein
MRCDSEEPRMSFSRRWIKAWELVMPVSGLQSAMVMDGERLGSILRASSPSISRVGTAEWGSEVR